MLLLLSAGAWAQSAATPQALIQGLNATLLYVMKNANALKYDGRLRTLKPRLTQVYHLPVMARIAIGTNWRRLSPSQQQRLVDGFSRMTIATYANRFDGWSGETFELRGMQEVRAKTVLVKTAILRPKDDPVEINYLMRRFEAGWRVIDVYLKQSYSELATKRSEYSSVLKREGFEALMRLIEEKIVQYSRTSS